MTDDPETTTTTTPSLDQLDEQTISMISEFGHQVVVVLDAPVPFGYTVGLALVNRPELFMTGNLNPRTFQGVLNAVAALPSHRLAPGKLLGDVLRGGFKVLLVPCDPEAAEMFQAIRVASSPPATPITALQVLWPDPAGRFPGDTGFDPVLFEQPTFPPLGG